MDDTNNSKDSKAFQWNNFIPKRQPDSIIIQEFIVYQKPGQDGDKYFIRKYDKSKKQNLEILNLIQEILNNTTKLSPKQIIEYCNSQRHFMKLYFKDLEEKRR